MSYVKRLKCNAHVTTHLSPYICHHTFVSTHRSAHICHHTSVITHLSPLICHHTSVTTHLSPHICHHASVTTHMCHHTSVTTHLSPHICHHTSVTTHLSPRMCHHTSVTILMSPHICHPHVVVLQRVNIDIERIHLPHDCSNGNISIFAGTNSPTSEIHTFCETVGGKYHYSSQDSILIVVSVNAADEHASSSFHVNYSVADVPETSEGIADVL